MILQSIALVLSSLPLSPQSVAPAPLPTHDTVRYLEPGAPALHVVYDVESHRIRSVTPIEPDRMELTDPPCFDNSEPSFDSFGVLPWVTTNVGEELVSWGWKNCRESSLLRSFTVKYASTATPVDRGGPGAALSMALFDGTRGFNRLGTEVFRHTITGLPSGHYIDLTVDFGTSPVPLDDGNIGWSFLQIDGRTGPVLARAPKTSLGTADALDLYSPGPASADTYVGTFNYGGCQGLPFGLCANLNIQLDEIPRQHLASSAVVNGTGVNPVRLSETFPARLGETWVGRIDLTGLPGTSTLLVASGATRAPVVHPFGELLLDPAAVLAAPFPGQGGYSFAIPADVTLAGARIFLQGLVVAAPGQPPRPPFLTNALRLRLGY